MLKVNKFQDELEMLKSIINKTGLKETIKWGAEVYTHKDKNVVGVIAFKNFLHFGFTMACF